MPDYRSKLPALRTGFPFLFGCVRDYDATSDTTEEGGIYRALFDAWTADESNPIFLRDDWATVVTESGERIINVVDALRSDPRMKRVLASVPGKAAQAGYMIGTAAVQALKAQDALLGDTSDASDEEFDPKGADDADPVDVPSAAPERPAPAASKTPYQIETISYVVARLGTSVTLGTLRKAIAEANFSDDATVAIVQDIMQIAEKRSK